MWNYTDTVKDHFINPRNVGALPDANALGEVGSLASGNALQLFLRIENNIITKAGFQTFGCPAAIASGSALTEMIKGKTVEESLAIADEGISAFLGGLPKEKTHCLRTARQALEKSIRNYRGASETENPDGQNSRIVCKCFGIAEQQIITAIQDNRLKTAEEITYFTRSGGACGECVEKITKVLETVLDSEATDPPPPLTNLQRMQKITAVIETVIRPSLQQDGVDLELIDIQEKNVIVTFHNNGTNFPTGPSAIGDFVQRVLQEQVEPDITVEEAQA